MALALIATACVAGLEPSEALAVASLRVSWQPTRVRPGDVARVVVRGVRDGETVEGSIAEQPLAFFPGRGRAVALAGIDVETPPGRLHWRVSVTGGAGRPRMVRGEVSVDPRRFDTERLTLPPGMVDLDEDTARRAEAEAERLRALYQTVTPERLWQGRFALPVEGAGAGTGFGARRIINGQPRSPHSGLDYPAERGAPVLAANAGRVALIGDFFFPGRFVVIDHGLGVHTAYFHLDGTVVAEQDPVARGQPIGLVGATGRATGPHLHFVAVVGSARVDPAALLRLDTRD